MNSTTLKNIKQEFNLSDNQEYEYSTDGEFLSLKLSRKKAISKNADVQHILSAIQKIEAMDIQENIPDLSTTYKQKLYSMPRYKINDK